MKLLPFTVLLLATSAQAETFEEKYNRIRAKTAHKGLTPGEIELYEEMMMGRDVSSCGCTNNDPHVYTYDGVHSECQGQGDYIYSKSSTTDFMVQARFSIEGTNSNWNAFTRTSSSETFFGTATKGAVVRTGVAGEPKVEAFAGNRLAGSRVGGSVSDCEMQWYFDDERITDLGGGNINSENDHGVYDLGWGIFWRSGLKRYIFFRASGLWMEYEKWEWKKWGCAVNVCVCPPAEIRDSGLIGILGSADGDKNNEYMTREGTTIARPDTIAGHNQYCQDNWCIGDDGTDPNIFKHPINTCDADVTHDLDIAIENVSEELKELCLYNERCILDSLVANDSTVGVKTLDTEKEQQEHDVDPTRNEEDGEETDEIDGLPTERYTGNKKCRDLGYDFGWKMDRCRENRAGDFKSDVMALTTLKNEATCDATMNPGSFALECGERQGNNKYKTATITPSVDTVVKIRGKLNNGNGGIVYKELKAGQTYTLETGESSQYIKDIEFCFNCPEPTCPDEVKECHDGSLVGRQAPACDFRACPECPADEKTCPDGTKLTRDFDDNCDFAECPACDDDTLTCPGGEVLTRSPENCAFPDCPVVPEVQDDPMTTDAPPGTRGDPHFKTHGGEMFDFHGGCDMVLLDNPSYNNGLGLTIHIRTKIETWWSYVESAVIKIGEETLEITGQDQKEWMWLNGVANEELTMGEFSLAKLAGNVVRYQENFAKGKAHRHEAHVHLGDGEKILFKTFDGFLKVEFIHESEKTLAGSKGVLGTFPEGKRVGRDGESVIEDVNVYGQEWQVTADEPKLFHSYDAPWVVPAGQKCAMPSEAAEKQALRRRRLADGIPTEAAEKACAHLSGGDFKACVYDVLATQNTDMAGAW